MPNSMRRNKRMDVSEQCVQQDDKEEEARWRKLKQEIIGATASLGIDQVGFTTADPFIELKARLQYSIDQGYASGFEEPDLDKRTQPKLLLEEARSIVAIAVAYPSKLEDAPKSEASAYRGIFARTAWGLDYHHVLGDRLNRLEAFIRARVLGKDLRVRSMVDTGELCDRGVAERAGIGFSGKNCSIISPKWGSWIYLGEMITNIPFPPDHPITDDCGDCTRCLDACPTNAFVAPGQLNAQLCLSFQTQSKQSLRAEMMRKMGNRLYGCDTCQIVCPKNKGLNWTHHEEMKPDPEIAKPLLVPILQLSNREFKDKFGSLSASWRGKKPIQRNAIVALGNFRDRSAVSDLNILLRHDVRHNIRATVAWSLGQIGGPEAKQALVAALHDEKEQSVVQAIQDAMEQCLNHVEPIYVQEMDSPIGTLTLAASATGLCAIEFGSVLDRSHKLSIWAQRTYGQIRLQRHPERLQIVRHQLEQYFQGERQSFDLAVCLTKQKIKGSKINPPDRLLTLDLQGTRFQRQVWQALLDIPYGETRSYKQIAQVIGRPKAVRAVGGANNHNPLPIIIPCHRVIGSNGRLVGYGGGVDKKIALLKLEGIQL